MQVRNRRKTLLALILSLCIMVGVLGPVTAFAAEEEEVKVTIVHVNDVHSRVDIEPYVSAIVKERKAAGENVILLSAGDVFHGQPIATLAEGSTIVEIMNAVGYDGMALGNHDFNYGWQRLEALQGMADFPLLAANIENTWLSMNPYTSYIIKEFGDVKVGVFGLSTPETVTKTNPKNVNILDFQDPLPVAQQMVRQLELAGCDVIVCLSHLGVDEETLPNWRSSAVANLGGVDVIVDGHSHNTLPEGELSAKGTLTAQTGSYGENIGIVELTVSGGKITSKTASLIPVAEAGTPDPAITALISKLNDGISSITSEVVSSTSVLLQGEREYARTQETNLGNLICDAMLFETGADVALTNGGGIRASIPAGSITKGDVLTVLPFGNYIVVKSVTGADILAALEHGIQSYPETAGGFPQIGGMSFTFDPSKPAGSRITSAQLKNGTPIDERATYRLATNDFMAAGGDGYEMLGTSGAPVSYSALDEALITYLQTSPVIPAGTQGRIVAAG